VITRSPDPTLRLELHSQIVEAGGSLVGELIREPKLDDSQTAGSHRIQGVRVEFGFMTEGRGDTDSRLRYIREFDVDEWGRLDETLNIAVPSDGPISYNGQLIRVHWTVRATAMISMAIDRHLEIPVLVVPRNGLDLYDRPHPLPEIGLGH